MEETALQTKLRPGGRGRSFSPGHPRRGKKENHEIKQIRTRFSSAIATYAHLLEHNYGSDAYSRRRRCVQVMLDSLFETLKLATNSDGSSSVLKDLRNLLCRSLRTFGVGDAALRQQILDIMEKITIGVPMLPTNRSMVESVTLVLIHFLPCTFDAVADADSSAQIMQTFRVVCGTSLGSRSQAQNHRGNIHLPFLKSLVNVPLHVSAQSEIILHIHETLPKWSWDDFPHLVSCLLGFCSTQKQYTESILCIRRSWMHKISTLLQDEGLGAPSLAVLRTLQSIVLSINAACEKNNDIEFMFQQSYLEILQDTASEQRATCLPLDIAYILYMKSQGSIEYCNQMTELLTDWGVTNRFPFDSLRTLCQYLSNVRASYGEELDRASGDTSAELGSVGRVLAQAVLNLAFSLVIDVEWCSRDEGNEELMAGESIAFTLFLHDSVLNSCDKITLLNSVVESWKHAVFSTGENDKHTARIINRTGRVVEEIAALDGVPGVPEWADMFSEALCLPLNPSVYDCVVRTCCCVLSCVGRTKPCFEVKLIQLIQKMLQSGNEREWASRGISLATACIRRSFLTNEETLHLIKEAVLRRVLPPQRTMIEPELGPPCLQFLQAWEDQKDSRSSVFKEFQMLVSNTGLIQSLSHYKKQTKKRKYQARLGFCRPLSNFVTEDQKEIPSMVFCVAHFIRSINLMSSGRFHPTIKWVFALVDTYLRIGRRGTSTKWRASPWLHALIELPKLFGSLKVHTEQQLAAIKWLDTELNDCELCEITRPASIRDDFQSRVVELLNNDTFIRESVSLLKALFDSSLSLYVSAVVMAAVVKNAFEHYKYLPSDDMNRGAILRQIGHQLLKVFHVRTRCKSVQIFAESLEGTLRRKGKPVPYSSNDGTTSENTLSAEASRDISQQVRSVKDTSKDLHILSLNPHYSLSFRLLRSHS